MQARRMASIELASDFFADSPMLIEAVRRGQYDYRYDPEHRRPPKGSGWEKTDKGWRKKLEKHEMGVPEQKAPEKVEAPQVEREKSPFHGDKPWHGKEKEVMEELSSNKPSPERWESGGGGINHMVFEKFASGRRAVCKSEDREQSPHGLRESLDGQHSQAKREALAYDVDSVLGLHIVPPTTRTRKNIPGSKKAEGEMCSVQLAVPGRTWSHAGVDYENPTQRKNIQRIAALDVIAGATDRHGGNCLVDGKTGQVYAIDNGLSFPNKDLRGIRSVALNTVRNGKNEYSDSNYLNGDGTEDIRGWAKHFDKDIIQHLATVKEDDFKKVFAKAGMDKEGSLAWKRLQALVEGAKPKAPPKPEHVKVYKDVKHHDKKDVADFGKKVRALHEQQDGKMGSPTEQDRRRIQDVIGQADIEDAARRNAEMRSTEPGMLINRGDLMMEHAGKIADADKKKKVENGARRYFEQAQKYLLNRHKELDVETAPQAPAPKPAPVAPPKPKTVVPPPAPVAPPKPKTVAPVPAPKPAPMKPLKPKKVPRPATPEVFEVVSCDRQARELLTLAKEILRKE